MYIQYFWCSCWYATSFLVVVKFRSMCYFKNHRKSLLIDTLVYTCMCVITCKTATKVHIQESVTLVNRDIPFLSLISLNHKCYAANLM